MGYKSLFKLNEEKFINVVKNSISVSQVLKSFGLVPSGANYKGFYRHVQQLHLSIEHFKGQGYLKGKNHSFGKKIPLEKILVENSSYGSFKLKNRLVKAGLLKYNCKLCEINKWNGKKISLHLEHINGINNDNRIDNLCLLCPNCHSQTNTYSGKNIGKYAKYIKKK